MPAPRSRRRLGRGGLDRLPGAQHEQRSAEGGNVTIRLAGHHEDVRRQAGDKRARLRFDAEVACRPRRRHSDDRGRIDPDPDIGLELEEQLLAKVGQVDPDIRPGYDDHARIDQPPRVRPPVRPGHGARVGLELVDVDPGLDLRACPGRDRRDRPGATIRHRPGDRLVEGPGPVRTEHRAVLDGVDAGLRRVADPRHAMRMRRDPLAEPMRFVRGRGQLPDRVGGEARVGSGGHATTGGHDLDPVRPLVDHPADRRANALDAVRLAAEEVAVAAGLGDRSAADHQPRAKRQASRNRVTDPVAGRPALTAVVGGRDAGSNHPLRGGSATDDQVVIGLGRHRREWIRRRGERNVDVGVDETRQGGRAWVGRCARILRALGPCCSGPPAAIRPSTISRAASSMASVPMPSTSRPTRSLMACRRIGAIVIRSSCGRCHRSCCIGRAVPIIDRRRAADEAAMRPHDPDRLDDKGGDP